MWKKSPNKRRGLYNYVKLNPRISTNVEFKTRSVEIRDQATLPSFFFSLHFNAIAKMVITERKEPKIKTVWKKDINSYFSWGSLNEIPLWCSLYQHNDDRGQESLSQLLLSSVPLTNLSLQRVRAILHSSPIPRRSLLPSFLRRPSLVTRRNRYKTIDIHQSLLRNFLLSQCSRRLMFSQGVHTFCGAALLSFSYKTMNQF